MSKLSDKTKDFLKEIFPHNPIYEERYIKYKGTRLFFDFYIKEMNVLIEVQGRQHDEFVKHFHVDREGFVDSKKRDNLKKEYCEETGSVLIEVRSEKELNKEEFIKRIWKGITS